MSDWLTYLEAFHFIRLWPLVLVPAVLFLWWRIRTRASVGVDLPKGIASHLAEALTVGTTSKRRFYPIDSVALILILILLGAAGPTWSRIPNPLVANTAPLAVVLKVSKSMDRTDLPPSRLERGKHKILDLLEGRAGARTALVAYAGSAHRVVPLTEDPAVIKPFLEGLSPQVMPSDGQNATTALALANAALAAEETPGAILFVLDTLDRADIPAFRKHFEDKGPGIVFLVTSNAAGDASALEGVPGASVVAVTPDGADVAQVERRLHSAYREALSRDDRQNWEDRGWVLAWPAALLMLFWFRRGWTLRWAMIVFASCLLMPGGEARAEGWRDWFLTPDQQGRLSFEDKDYSRAAELFEDPIWKGYVLYRNGKYSEAAEVFAWLPSSEAAFAEGVALVKGRSYRDGIAAFEKALERDPDHEAAARNLKLTRHILEYLETTREQSDTGEESGIGADDVVYDNEAGRGAETTREYGDADVRPETAEQWMRTVDTRTADFLKIRFSLEAARGAK
jgi:Ca-activated chloride channel family protein